MSAEWKESGLRYCLTHKGVVDCYEDEPCDFVRGHDHKILEGEQFDCVLRPLCYQSPSARPTS